MAEEFEVIHYDQLHHFKIFVNRIAYRNYHIHNVFEFLLIFDGSGTVKLRDEEILVGPGSLVLVNPQQPHESSAPVHPVTALVFQFSQQLFYDYFPQLRQLRFTEHLIAPQELRDFCTQELCKASLSYLQEEPYYALDCLAHMALLLKRLLLEFPYEILSGNSHTALSLKAQRMTRIIEYIDAHYTEQIRLKELAQAEHITENHLSHLFTDYFGISFQAYLNNLRFEKAIALLGQPELSQLDIALRVGFSDPKYFSRIMKQRMGCSVGEYRKKYEGVPRPAANEPSPMALEQRLERGESIAVIQAYLSQ